MKKILLAVLALMLCTSAVLMTACGGGGGKTDYENLREVSWEGTELTIKLGENQSTGCKWTTKPEDDSVIDYSINRVFHLADSGLLKGEAIGTLEAGFKGKGAGTSRVICTTPVGWDGTGAGLTYIVTVTVNEDGTIENAEGEETDTPPETEPEKSEESEKSDESEETVESYFEKHPDELKQIKDNINSDESISKVMDVDVTADGNTLNYIYTFKETYSDAQIEQFKPELKESMEGELADEMKAKIPDIEKGFGLTGVKLYMEYRNGDGTKILGTTYE